MELKCMQCGKVCNDLRPAGKDVFHLLVCFNCATKNQIENKKKAEASK